MLPVGNHRAGLNGENSRAKVQNVGGDNWARPEARASPPLPRLPVPRPTCDSPPPCPRSTAAVPPAIVVGHRATISTAKTAGAFSMPSHERVRLHDGEDAT